MKKRQLRRKEKVYTEKVPKQKKIHSKKAVKWIWCLVLFLCFSGGLAFFQSMKTKVQVSFLKDEIQQLQKKEVQSRSELTYTPEIESFMNRFVALYMNTFDNHEQEQQRQETLKKEFYAQNFIQEPGSVSGVRKLTAASFIGLKEIETIPTASYKVTYDIRSMNPESKKETSVTITQVLNLPFSISNKGCRIIAYPYFTALPKNTEKQRMITYDDTLYETVDASEAKDVEGFVEDFLDKYAKN
ncbi:conjugal transfer protein, partial [Enterococcus faecium]